MTTHDAHAAEFVAQVATVATAQRDLVGGLRAIADETPSRRLARELRQLSTALERGEPLPQALTESALSRSPHVVALLSAGLETHRLVEVLTLFGQHEQRLADVRRRLQAAIAYPLVLLGLLIVTTVFLLLYVVAPVHDLFGFYEALGIQADLITAPTGLKVLEPYRDAILTGTVALVVAMTLLLLNGGIGRFGEATRWLPLVGPLWTWIAWSQTLDLWSMLIRSSVPLPEVLRLTGSIHRDRGLARIHRRLTAAIDQGRSLGDVLRAQHEVPPTVAAFLAWGEGQGALADSARSAAEYCRGRVDDQLGLIRAVFPPLAMLLVMSVLVFLYSQLFLLFRLLRALT